MNRSVHTARASGTHRDGRHTPSGVGSAESGALWTSTYESSAAGPLAGSLGVYRTGGLITEARQPKLLSYRSLEAFQQDPGEVLPATVEHLQS